MSRAAVGPTVGVVLVGDELLSGAVEDTNGPYLIARFRALGARLKRVTVVGDDVAEIAEVVSHVAAACDLVCTTGGIGPTHDDVTVDGVARAFGLPVAEDPRIIAWMRARLGREPGPGHRRMARVPQGTEILTPARGPGPGAPPTLVTRNVTILPGVPSLMRACFALVEDRFRGAPRWRQTIEVTANEASLAERLREIAAAHPRVAIGSYPRLQRATGKGDESGSAGGGAGTWVVGLAIEGDELPEVQTAARAVVEALSGLSPTVAPPQRVGPDPDGERAEAAARGDAPLNSPGHGGT